MPIARSNAVFIQWRNEGIWKSEERVERRTSKSDAPALQDGKFDTVAHWRATVDDKDEEGEDPRSPMIQDINLCDG